MSKTKTTKEFIKEVSQIDNGNFIVLGEYINCHTNIKMKSLSCGHEFETMPTHFLERKRCPKCNREVKKWDETTIKEKLKNDFPDFELVELLKDYNLKLKHLKCGKVFTKNWKHIDRDGIKCKCCETKDRLTESTFKERLKNRFTTDEYELKSKFLNVNTHVKILHKKCGSEFSVLPYHILKDTACPFCSYSKSEIEILNFLKSKNIETVTQFKDERCKKQNYLPFDFYIKERNILLEYDGEFHYLPIIDEERLKIQQENDQFKNTFAKENNFILLRIPFWEKNNLEEIMTKIFEIEDTSKLEKEFLNILTYKDFKVFLEKYDRKRDIFKIKKFIN